MQDTPQEILLAQLFEIEGLRLTEIPMEDYKRKRK